ncbi:proteasome assembly chaperone [Raphidocelis subcapitata]|uniref:Proteasome assembly chaperone 2 n=1 Tax=Raphidocelis subcapitata TaxID=307507 RepID=A0A2V0P2S1_9CHLO|nr:proteasome assembly chaperone [Raphidocelis subcapitata]|eukprot:GBF93879.1 proteasome assembly chaperone [Raphidocelis subcapitata]
MQLYPEPGRAPPDLRGATVVLPAVAFFNVGELAVDALIATLGAAPAGRLDDADLLPVVGCGAFDHAGAGPEGRLATAMELYWAGQGSKVFLIQQRAPAIPGRQRAFAESLAAWLASSGVAHVVVLSGLDAQYRRESQLEGSQARALSASELAAAAAAAEPEAEPPLAPGSPRAAPRPGGSSDDAAAAAAAAVAARLGGLSLGGPEAAASEAARALGAPRLEPDAIARELELHPLLPPWPLLRALSGARVPATLLGRFAAEGDNVADGLALGALLLQLLAAPGLLPGGDAAGAAARGGGGGGAQQLRTPASWAGLYGRPYAEVA